MAGCECHNLTIFSESLKERVPMGEGFFGGDNPIEAGLPRLERIYLVFDDFT